MKTLSLNSSSSCVSNFPPSFMVEVSKEHEISYINCESKIMVLFVLWQYKTYIVFFSIRIEVKDKFEHLCCAFSLPEGTAEQPVSWQTPIYIELLNCTTQVPKMLVLCFHAYMNIRMKNKPVVQMETLRGYRDRSRRQGIPRSSSRVTWLSHPAMSTVILLAIKSHSIFCIISEGQGVGRGLKVNGGYNRLYYHSKPFTSQMPGWL